MVKIIAVHNQKGGVGKTTTTTNVGFELARKGYKVLLADLDPQATLTSALGVTDPEETVFSALQGAVDGKETRLPWIRLQENISLCARHAGKWRMRSIFCRTNTGGKTSLKNWLPKRMEGTILCFLTARRLSD